MALERVPADIRAQGGVARMSDPKMIKEIMETVTIPVMAKARIGHFVECQVRPVVKLTATQHPARFPPPLLNIVSNRLYKRHHSANMFAPRSSRPSA